MGNTDLMGRLSELLFVGGYVASGIVFVLLYRLYQALKTSKRPTVSPQASQFTELAIVFQTFRSVIHDQKTLAREFNESLDKRIEFLKQIVKYGAREQQKVYEAQRKMQERLEYLSQELKAIEQRLLEERMHDTIVRASSQEWHEKPSAPVSVTQPETPSAATPMHIVAGPEEAPAGESAEEWVGLDFVGQEPQQYEVPEQPPETPKDPEAARQAFRALLNMESEESKPAAKPEGDNGKGRQEPGGPDLVRSRVYEYHDAGMTVAQIARELGMGKGEVRLMIGLRERKAN